MRQAGFRLPLVVAMVGLMIGCSNEPSAPAVSETKARSMAEVMLVGPDDAFVKHEGQAEVVEGPILARHARSPSLMVRGHSLPSRARNRETRIHGCERQKHGTDPRRIAGEVDYGYHRE